MREQSSIEEFFVRSEFDPCGSLSPPVTTNSTVPDAPTIEPETEPQPAPVAPPPQRKPDLDPFNPPWPEHRPEPQPKA